MRKRPFRVLVATDASPQARAALAAALAFPWPDGTRAQGVMVTGVPALSRWRRHARTALLAWLRREAVRVRRTLRRRWANAEVMLVDPPVVSAIVERARKWRAQVIVLGSRGRGAVQRALLGSVSRDVMHEADCAVLVFNGKVRAPRRVLIGLDGSVLSRRAVGFVVRVPPPPGGRVTLLAIVEPTTSTSIGRMPASVRAVLAAEIAALDRERLATAKREVSTAARRLTRAGWAVEEVVLRGIPLPEILRVASMKRATDIIIVGARGAGGLKRLLLGSVAEGTFAHAPISVLIVK
jgi:nucleotide-binding universal stress UspA family protein